MIKECEEERELSALNLLFACRRLASDRIKRNNDPKLGKTANQGSPRGLKIGWGFWMETTKKGGDIKIMGATWVGMRKIWWGSPPVPTHLGEPWKLKTHIARSSLIPSRQIQ